MRTRLQFVAPLVVRNVPYSAQLLAALLEIVLWKVRSLRFVIVEAVLPLLAPSMYPKNGFVTGSEATRREIGERISFEPDYLVDYFQAQDLAGDVYYARVVIRSMDPDGPSWFHDSLEFRKERHRS